MAQDRHECRCSCGRLTPDAKLHLPFVSRRQFLHRAGALTAGLAASRTLASAQGGAQRGPMPRVPLKVQPVLTYSIPKRRPATSWRNWGGIQTQEDAQLERTRITQELARLSSETDFPVEMRPVSLVLNAEEAGQAAKGDHDVLLLYAAGGDLKSLEALTLPDRWNVMFLRHDPGPVYLWYEIVHPRFLRKTVDDYGQAGWDVNDVVVDEYSELLWRLRALSGLKHTLGKKVVAIGGTSGWGRGGQSAPARTRELWKMDFVDFPYQELSARIQSARRKPDLVRQCTQAAGAYLKQPGVLLKTTRTFLDNAFLLNDIFKDIMEESRTDALTVNSCMGTIMPMSETTACMPLSILNDEGFLAFCESDFVVIPSGVLLHYISGKPVFLNDPTYPHGGIVTLAHCTAPRKMDGKGYEPTHILTHFESDYGAAPKVEMKIGQRCTNLIPDFASRHWVGFDGTITANPWLDICRSQIDVRIDGDCEALLRDMKGFHWMMSYGSYLREVGYALHKVGVEFQNVSKPAAVGV